ncbi:MAG: class I SAM-dependent methyltransferase [Steroidobacteraceae bacterium]
MNASGMLEKPSARPALNLAERIFLRTWCFKPPPVPFEPRDQFDWTRPPPIDPKPLALVGRVFGDQFEQALRGKVFVDIGCGYGDQVLGAARAGCKFAVGVDRVDVYLRIATSHAEREELADRVQFTMDMKAAQGEAWADVALSQNSFEHFRRPAEILAQAFEALKPGGRFFITFGPSWWHPFGVHHMFMIRLPCAHYFFSERTILRVRQLFRPNAPITWGETGLNQMTVRKLLALCTASGFELTRIVLTPIRPLPRWLTRLRPFREWMNSNIAVVLTKPSESAS